MSNQRDGLGTWVIILMLGLCTWVLTDIYQEMKLQRTPEQLELLAKREATEAQTEAYLKEQREQREAELKAMPWSQAGFTVDAVEKYIAHGYFKWLAGFMVILSGPFLMRSRMRN